MTFTLYIVRGKNTMTYCHVIFVGFISFEINVFAKMANNYCGGQMKKKTKIPNSKLATKRKLRTIFVAAAIALRCLHTVENAPDNLSCACLGSIRINANSLDSPAVLVLERSKWISYSIIKVSRAALHNLIFF